MSDPAIRVGADFYAVRVFIDEMLHVHVNRADLLAVHSWTDHASSFSIEYAMRDGNLVTEYDDRERWTAILAGLAEVL